MLTKTVAPSRRSSGSFSATNRWTPMPCRPMAFSMPGRRLDDARRRVAFALGEEQALHRDAAERREVDRVGVLEAVAEAAGCGDDRVPEGERADVNGEIHAGLSARSVSGRQPIPDDVRRRRPGRRDRIARSARREPRADGHDATVAAAHAAAHDRLERDEDRAAGGAAEVGDGAHHRRRAAGVDRDGADRRAATAAARSSGAVTRPRSPRVPSSVVRTSVAPSRSKSDA